MLPGETYSYLSAKLVRRNRATRRPPLTGLVPPLVEQKIRAKIGRNIRIIPHPVSATVPD